MERLNKSIYKKKKYLKSNKSNLNKWKKQIYTSVKKNDAIILYTFEKKKKKTLYLIKFEIYSNLK